MPSQNTEEFRISPEDAKARIDSGQAVILDVVAPKSWAEMPSAIEGAIRIDPKEIEQRYSQLRQDEQVIAYCT